MTPWRTTWRTPLEDTLEDTLQDTLDDTLEDTPGGHLVGHLRGHLACGVIDTACKIFAFENRSYLGEFEEEFKKALARESGAQEVLFDEKKPEGRKSRDTVPLTGSRLPYI
jgi:hypothetical protein